MKNFILYVSPTRALACQPAAETAFFSLENLSPASPGSTRI